MLAPQCSTSLSCHRAECGNLSGCCFPFHGGHLSVAAVYGCHATTESSLFKRPSRGIATMNKGRKGEAVTRMNQTKVARVIGKIDIPRTVA